MLLFGRRATLWILGVLTALVVMAGVGMLSRIAQDVTAQKVAAPIAILPPGTSDDGVAPGSIEVEMPDKRIFVFSAGTDKAAVLDYVRKEYRKTGSLKADVR